MDPVGTVGVYQRQCLSETQLDFPGLPYSVSVLKVGYCSPQTDGTFRADGTISLITGIRTILVDTGGSWDREFLLRALEDRGLRPGDIGLVVATHGHSDHIGNLNLFPSAQTIVGFDISEGDRYRPNQLAQGQNYSVDEHILVPAIHIHLTSAKNCCANRCGMFLSIGFAAIGVLGAIFSLSVASVGLSNGPVCSWSDKNSLAEEWGRPFANSSGSYLGNKTSWSICKIPDNVVEFNVGLFSTLLVAASLELILCAIQMVNGLFGCLCGTCSGKE